ncbi:protein containing cAMP-binding domain of CRP [Lentimicrobium saccharophilum]|uniref:Protein containing cAMP-binding domain of CRP n=1 Tax=Lentimicrobium saccharophilum TaxID=1678841 RepID=A0A0S7C3B5_9BACT|nr:Crp/Fnr family transcriptional regulator [Lentimicrobium saccharophilum]GAP43926.1 protein containing cAMP-binding domain of CRP [Lentimicrobium saccharophilum]
MKTFIPPDDCSLGNIDAPCFRNLLPEEIDLARNSKTRVIFRKGENLTKQGAFASSVLFIMDGLAKQYVEGDATRNFNLRLLKGGEFVGLSVAFNNHTYQYSVVALRETTACLIEKEAVTSLIKANGAFAYNIINRYCAQNSKLYNSIRDLMYKQMNGRLAGALLYLWNEQVSAEVFPYLSRKDIADFAGLSTESTVKLLKTFEKEGLISLEDKDIRLNDVAGLEQINLRG